MRTVERFRRLYAYNDWANHETIASLRGVPGPSPRALAVMSHIIGAEWLWLGRLGHERKAVAVWPELTLDQGQAQLGELKPEWEECLRRLTSASLSRRIAYTNSKGERWTSTVEDILMHVVMHSAYHRGQIASELRAADQTPAYTDFIHCARQGFLE